MKDKKEILRESRLSKTKHWANPEIFRLSKEDAVALIKDLTEELAGVGIEKESFYLNDLNPLGHTVIFKVDKD